MVRRSTSYPAVANVVCQIWLPPPESERARGAATLHPAHEQIRKGVLHNFTLFSAREAPIVSLAQLGSVRCLVIVPVAFNGYTLNALASECHGGMQQ